MLRSELKQDEPMDTSEIPSEDFVEEGEIQSSDNEEVFLTDAKQGSEETTVEPPSSEYSLSSLQEMKRLSRAKRFGIPMEQGRTVLVDSGILTRLYKSLGICEENEKHYRFNVIHMRGTENMSTDDVLDYFAMYPPLDIEWINDSCCNLVWPNQFCAAKALVNLSKEIKNVDKVRFNANPFKRDFEKETEEPASNTDNDAVDAREIDGAIPPGHWRIGTPSEKSPAILLRLATRTDKKPRFAEKNSKYYKKYGNPHFGNLPGLVSTSLRKELIQRYRKMSHNTNENRDDKKDIRKNPWGSLAAQWSKQDESADAKPKVSVKCQKAGANQDLRLSIINKHAKRQKDQQKSDSEASQFENDGCARGAKFPKMKMYADDEGKIASSPRRNRMNSPNGDTPYVEDLRLKIDRSRKRKRMLEEASKGKRKRFWKKFTSAKRTGKYSHAVKEADNDDNDNDNDNNNEIDDCGGCAVGDDEDEEKGSAWALENYSDLRESLEHTKKHRKPSEAGKAEKSDKSDNDNEDDDDDVYKIDFQHRSPLQIEFENDDYFEIDSL